MSPFLKIVLIFLIGFALTSGAYKVTTTGLKKYSAQRIDHLNEIFTGKTNYDILFLGSSRTQTTVFPKIIDSITGLSSYNAGVNGGAMLDFKMTLDGYLVNHPAPKFLVLTIDPHSFNKRETTYEPVQYFHLIKKNKIIEKTFSSTGFHTFLIKYIPALNFIYMDDYAKNNAIAGFRGKTEIAEGEFVDKGFISNTMKCIDTAVKLSGHVNYVSPDPKTIEMFQAMVDTCKNKNIQLILTYAPEYRHQFQTSFKNFKTFTGLIYDKTLANQLLFYRDDSLAMINDPCMFANSGHVNIFGAIEYSKILGQRISFFQKK